METFIREVPPEILYKLYNVLDISGRNNWKQLGALAGYTYDQIQRFEQVRMSGGSPTEELVRVWSYKNVTATTVFNKLAEMRHAQAMKLIKNYVDPKLHYKITEIEGRPLGESAPQHHPVPQRPERWDQYMPANPAPLRTPELKPVTPPFQQLPMRYPSPGKQLSQEPSSMFAPAQPSHQNHLHPGRSFVENHFPTKYSYPEHSMYPPNSPIMSPPEPRMPSEDISKREREQIGHITAMNTTIHKDYEEIKRATNNFDEKRKLGEGSFGRVYLAVINQTKYAVKVLLQNDHLQVAIHNNHRSDQTKELTALAKFKHKNIVLMCFFSVNGENPCIIYEYLENGSLEDNLQCQGGKEPLDWKRRHYIAEGAALGINHLHKASKNAPLIHGDIKSANILLDRHFEPKISDFGLARPGPSDGKTSTLLMTQYAHGTLPYLPEEFQRHFQLSIKVDSFSFGVVLMEILTGERAYDEKREPHQLLSSYVSDVTTNWGMESAVTHLKDNKCSDWPDEFFTSMLSLAKKLVQIKKHRPEMDQAASELRAMNASFQENGTLQEDEEAKENTDLKEPRETEDKDVPLSPEEQRIKQMENFNKRMENIILASQNGSMGQVPATLGPQMGQYNHSPGHQVNVSDRFWPPVESDKVNHAQTKQPERDYRPTANDSGRRFPATYQSQISPQTGLNGADRVTPANDALYSSWFQDSSGTTPSGNSSSFMHRFVGGKEGEIEQIYRAGFEYGLQQGYQQGFQAACQSFQMGAMSGDQRYRHLSRHELMRHPGYSQSGFGVAPLSSYGEPTCPPQHLRASMDPGPNRMNPNKTDDAKITTSGNIEANSHEKSVSALQTKPISLHELRHNKEPQQSTEPMPGE